MHTDGTGISAAQLVAYRGGKSEGPENTLPSLARAAALGVASEVDVRVAADGVPVLAHDASMLRTAGQDLVVEQTSSAMLRRVRACHGHDVRDPAEHRVPSLAEAFEVFEGELVLDLRADAAGVREIAGVIDDCAAWDRVTIVSESEPTLRALLTLRPTARYGATRRRAWVRRLGTSLGLAPSRADVWMVPERVGPLHVVSDRFMDAARRSGEEVWVWVVDDVPRAERLLARGARRVMTTRPAHLLGLDALT
ncbi:MAG: hypothetical protein KC619_25645 [Myxococcales bacterium]|nr:hypothetical protein [Myxococcales bacterium]